MNLFISAGEGGFHTAPKMMEEGKPLQDQVRTTKKDEADGQFYYWFSFSMLCAIVFAYHYQIPLFPLDA